MWSLTYHLTLNDLLHTGQCVFPSLCTATCWVKYDFVVKPLLHMVHWYGFLIRLSFLGEILPVAVSLCSSFITGCPSLWSIAWGTIWEEPSHVAAIYAYDSVVCVLWIVVSGTGIEDVIMAISLCNNTE